MSGGQSWRIPVDDSYVLLVGRATYHFAYLEWGIVWIGEKLQPGFLQATRSLTVGKMANMFREVCQAVNSETLPKDRLAALATKFKELVDRRNQLMHGNPFTAEGRAQRLRYQGKSGECEWTEDEIKKVALEFQTAAIEANDLLHGRLMGDREERR